LLQEKESFFTGLSHDLLTLFSLILAPVNDLLRDSSDECSRKEKLEIINRNTAFLSDIFGTILDFKRVELSENQVKEVNVELVSFSHIVLNAFEYLATSRNIRA
jgi:signal transduction histidine kinase